MENSDPSPLPNRSPTPAPLFLVVLFTCYHSLWLQEKYILRRKKILDSRRFIYLHISINDVNLRIRSRRKA